MLERLTALHVTVRVEDAAAFVAAARRAGWSAVDSGERVTTDEGVDREVVLVVRIPVAARASVAEA